MTLYEHRSKSLELDVIEFDDYGSYLVEHSELSDREAQDFRYMFESFCARSVNESN